MRWTCQSSGVKVSLRVSTRRCQIEASERFAGNFVLIPGRRRKAFSLRRFGVSSTVWITLEGPSVITFWWCCRDWWMTRRGILLRRRRSTVIRMIQMTHKICLWGVWDIMMRGRGGWVRDGWWVWWCKWEATRQAHFMRTNAICCKKKTYQVMVQVN